MRRKGQKSKSRGASPRTLEAAGHFKFGLLLTPAASRTFIPAPKGLRGRPSCPERPLSLSPIYLRSQ
jgi:hypothetical protein